jgi:hypothetical protein
VKVVKGDATTAADPSDRLAVNRAYPHTYGQPLVQLMPSSESTTVAKHAPLRFVCITVLEEADLAFCENPSWRGNLVEKSNCSNQFILRNQFCVFSCGNGAFALIRPLPSSPFLRSWMKLAVEGLPCIC